MCMITILSPKNIEKEPFDYNFLRNSHYFNEDGHGFAYVANIGTPKAKVKILKSVDISLTKFIKLLKRARTINPDSYFLIHQRNATKGLVNNFNCHPFLIGDIAMAHNGTIYKFNLPYNAILSDSVKFADMLTKLPERWYEEDAYYTLLQDYIGTTANRAAFLLPTNEYRTIGTEKWVQYNDDVLFSNDYFKKEIPLPKAEAGKDSPLKCCKCGSDDIHASAGTVYYCENCYIELKNAETYGTVPDLCRECETEMLVTDAEISSGICNNCFHNTRVGA